MMSGLTMGREPAAHRLLAPRRARAAAAARAAEPGDAGAIPDAEPRAGRPELLHTTPDGVSLAARREVNVADQTLMEQLPIEERPAGPPQRALMPVTGYASPGLQQNSIIAGADGVFACCPAGDRDASASGTNHHNPVLH